MPVFAMQQYLSQEMNLAKQHNELLRQCFMAQCEMYDPDMMVFVDETGCDRCSSMRKFER